MERRENPTDAVPSDKGCHCERLDGEGDVLRDLPTVPLATILALLHLQQRKSIAENFAEVFFTKIPPPLNDFCSQIGEDALEAGFYTPYIGLDVTGTREKIDIDIGQKEVLVGGMHIPTVLQNIDYGSFEVSSDYKNRNEGNTTGPLASAWVQQGSEGAGTSVADNIACRDETSGDDAKEISSSNTCSTRTSTEANAAVSEDEAGEDEAKDSSS